MNTTVPSILPPVKRLVAIGDVHGDYRATLIALRKAKLIDSKNKWIGGDTVVIQLGDQVDRASRSDSDQDENSELKIINLFNRLHKQAQQQGGAVYSLLGNHELMNVFGDFSYASPMGIKSFGGPRGRREQFRPGGPLAIKLAKTRNVVMKIGDFVFVHGGILPRLARKYKLYEINNMMRSYLNGNLKLENDSRFRELFENQGSLLWTRCYSEDKPNCQPLYEALNILGAKYMVVAHTPQDQGINCKCNRRVWRIDTGMSKAFGKKRNNMERIQILEILNNGRKINVI